MDSQNAVKSIKVDLCACLLNINVKIICWQIQKNSPWKLIHGLFLVLYTHRCGVWAEMQNFSSRLPHFLIIFYEINSSATKVSP